MSKEKTICDEANKRLGLIARILGGQPTILQKTVFWLMVLSLLIWPIGFFASIFFFDAPINTTMDGICRWGMVLTIWLYPLYLIPLMRLLFWLSKHFRASWLFFLCPLVPVTVFSLFVAIASSDFAAEKPEVKYIDPTQDNLVQMYNKIQKAARPNNNHNGNMDIYDHNVKRVYDKVKFLFPNADISI